MSLTPRPTVLQIKERATRSRPTTEIPCSLNSRDCFRIHEKRLRRVQHHLLPAGGPTRGFRQQGPAAGATLPAQASGVSGAKVALETPRQRLPWKRPPRATERTAFLEMGRDGIPSAPRAEALFLFRRSRSHVKFHTQRNGFTHKQTHAKAAFSGLLMPNVALLPRCRTRTIRTRPTARTGTSVTTELPPIRLLEDPADAGQVGEWHAGVGAVVSCSAASARVGGGGPLALALGNLPTDPLQGQADYRHKVKLASLPRQLAVRSQELAVTCSGEYETVSKPNQRPTGCANAVRRFDRCSRGSLAAGVATPYAARGGCYPPAARGRLNVPERMLRSRKKPLEISTMSAAVTW